MPFDSFYHMCCGIFRMGLRFFAEGVFIYLIVNNINNQNVCKKSNTLSKKKMLLFSSFYTLVVLSVAIFAIMFTVVGDTSLFRLASVSLVFFYSYYKRRKIQENLVSNYNNTQNIWYALTTAIILTLALHSFNIISYILFHNTFVVTGIYETVRSIDVAYQFYKTAIVFLDVSLMFLVYKFRFIKTRDLKNMSMHKRIPISFAFCLLSMIYLDSVYDVTPSSFVWYCQSLMWAMALMLPTYIGFYLTTAYLTRLLSLRSNTTADVRILVWLSNPSMMKTTHLDVYDSKVFIANFELKKLDIKKRLEKLGINDEYNSPLFKTTCRISC